MLSFKQLVEIASRYRIFTTIILACIIWAGLALIALQIRPHSPIDSGGIRNSDARQYVARSLRWLCADLPTKQRLFVVGASNARAFRPAYLASRDSGREHHLLLIPAANYDELDMVLSQLLGCLDQKSAEQATIVLMTIPWLFFDNSMMPVGSRYPEVLNQLDYDVVMQRSRSVAESSYTKMVLIAEAPLQLYDSIVANANTWYAALRKWAIVMFRTSSQQPNAEDKLIEKALVPLLKESKTLLNNEQVHQLIALVKQAQERGVRFVILQSPYSATLGQKIPKLMPLRNELRKIAQENEIEVIDFIGQVKRNELHADGIHPEESAGPIWSARLVEALRIN